MSFSNLSFLNPLSKESGVKLPKKGADKIQDKTVIENVRILYKKYKSTKEKYMRRDFPDYLFFAELGFTYNALTGLHYGEYTHLDEPKEEGVGRIGAKGILDFLAFPLIARKLLWDSLIFISNDKNYRLSGTIDDLSKGICWVGLIPSVALALGLEIIRLSLAAAITILSVYAAVFATPIWLPIFAIYFNYCSPNCSPNSSVEGYNAEQPHECSKNTI